MWRSLTRAELLGLSIIVVTGALLRWSQLDGQGLWWDELALWHAAHGGHAGPHEGPFVPWLCGAFMALVDRSDPNAVRAVPLLAGIATIPLTFAAARAIAGRRVGLFAAALIAANPFAVWYSLEARPYSMVHCLVPLLLLSVVRALETGRPRWWALYGAAVGVSCATHLLLCQVVAVFAVYACVRSVRRPDLRVLAVFAGVTVVACACGLFWIVGRDGLSTAVETDATIGLAAFARTALAALTYATPDVSDLGLIGTPAESMSLVIVTLVVLGGWSLARRDAWRVVLLGVAIALPLAITWWSLGAKGTWDTWTRYASPALAPLVILMAIGIDRVVRRTGAAGALALVAVFAMALRPSLRHWMDVAAVVGGEHRDAVARVHAMADELQGVVVFESRSRYGDETQRLLTTFDVFPGPTPPRYLIAQDGAVAPAVARPSRFWLRNTHVFGRAESVRLRPGRYASIARSAPAARCGPLRRATGYDVRTVGRYGTLAVCELAER